MNIRYSEFSDKEELKKIWFECFSDSCEFVDWNFENNYSPENVMLVEDNGKIVSNLHIIPYEIAFSKNVLKGAYISAVATPKEDRGKGYNKMLINKVLDELEKKDIDIAFLVPAIEGYYEKFGFIKIAEKTEDTVQGYIPAFDENIKVKDATEEDVLKIYLMANRRKKLYLKRNLKDTKLILSDLTENTKGRCEMLECKNAYVMYKEYEDKIKVFEMLGTNKEAREEIMQYMFSFGRPLEFELPALMVKPLNKKIKAEDFLLPGESIYFNLIL